MKAFATDAGIEGLSVRELPAPEPGPGEVRVRVRTSALNPADGKVLRGEFVGNVLHGRRRPIVTGWDLAGTVDAVGPGADLAVGDEVWGFLAYSRSTKQGTFAELAVAPAASLARRPASLSPATAVALATAGATALQALRDVAKIRAGQKLLVIGASGGVGSLAVPIGVRLGATVTGVCSAAAADFVRAQGASAVIERGKEMQSQERFDVVFDAAAAWSFGRMKSRLERGGIYVSTLPSPGLLVSMLTAPLQGKRSGFLAVKSVRADLDRLAQWVADGMKVPIDSTFPVAQLANALDRQARGGMKGRVVIGVEGGFGS